ncbi:hypothetical protein LWI29_027461 [Acer saccharum]|uniref:SWIM-type domain-containing protein n=1 Tax=Acer saccharum TaxID=4024 RepID=A0AA39SF39_ACESA|nr:hypothetical protein LWI29_027461 [Acer saccharum]
MSDFLGQVRKDFVVQPYRTQVYRAKLMAGELVEGWLHGCRKIIGLDACHVKSYHKAQLLWAVGIDADNGYYPIAYAVVEKECHVESIGDIWPTCEHRFCVRHMYASFKKKFKDDIIRGKLWKAARSTKIEDFQTCMAEIKELNENAWKWLNGISPSQWSKSFFSVHSKCDMTLNNLCEIVNGDREVLEARKVLDLEAKKSGNFVAHWGGQGHYQVSINQTPIAMVNLKGKNCTCRKWNLTGIPCQHAIAAIYSECEDLMKYVDICYHKESQMKCYGDVMYGINMEKYWTKTGRPPLIPPRTVK